MISGGEESCFTIVAGEERQVTHVCRLRLQQSPSVVLIRSFIFSAIAIKNP